MTTYITFGPDHANLHPHVGAQLNRGYVAIDTGTRDRDIAAALAVLGKQWAFDYQDADRLDARYPDGRKLRYLVGYWSDMMALKHDRDVAYRAVDYIASRLQATGLRQPPEGVVYEAAREFIARECNK